MSHAMKLLDVSEVREESGGSSLCLSLPRAFPVERLIALSPYLAISILFPPLILFRLFRSLSCLFARFCAENGHCRASG